MFYANNFIYLITICLFGGSFI